MSPNGQKRALGALFGDDTDEYEFTFRFTSDSDWPNKRSNHGHRGSNRFEGMFDQLPTPANDAIEKMFDEIVLLEPRKRVAINPDSKSPIYIHPHFAKALKEHQLEGVRFLWKIVVEGKCGAVLAHTMGLGKTLQAITFIWTLLNAVKDKSLDQTSLPLFKDQRVLILLPLTTLANWVNEFYRWVPQDEEGVTRDIYNLNDAVGENRYSRAQLIQYLQHWYTKGGTLLVTYESFRSLLTSTKDHHELQQLRTMLLDPGPSVLIADEGHRIKNPNAIITKLVYQVRTPARVCLSGYPVQNNLAEFHCIMNFVNPKLFPPYHEYKEEFKAPIERVYADSSSTALYQSKCKLLLLQLMTNRFIQRKGREILQADLPPKTEYYIYCPLTPLQYKLYTALLTDITNSDMAPLISVIILRAICNHPLVLQKMVQAKETPPVKPKKNQPQLSTEAVTDLDTLEAEKDLEINDDDESEAISPWLSRFKDNPAADLLASTENLADPSYSSKITIMIDIVKEAKRINEKVLLVSHSLACLDYMEKVLSDMDVNALRMDGQTPQSERQPMVDKFNTDSKYDIMLISARAGSLGINIVGSSRVILFDVDWNPCHDEQSIGRAYRYGQKKPVTVYRLIAYSTMEQKLSLQSVHKRGLASRIVDNKLMTPQDRKEMKEYYTVPEEDPQSLADKIDFSINDSILRRVLFQRKQSIVDISLGDLVETGGIQVSKDLSVQDREAIQHQAKVMLARYYGSRPHKSRRPG